MNRLLLLGSFLLFSLAIKAQPVASPSSFLGYAIGSHFTPHHKMVDYFKLLAQQNASGIKLESYGKTYEGRELMLAFISSSQNVGRLEEIRRQNLDLVRGSGAANNLGVTIVWLSYNVHGNEPSSSEAAMVTAYELLKGGNEAVQQWLNNTIVIIDPCLNPDGRDRYVNWYNTTRNKNYNVDPQSREHTEPWPQGRTNHYYFDLNRDWSWQTQVETEQRIKVYNNWMPHIHVDFHEQFYNDPYYFAPAAEPLHPVITPWQRELQTIIGKNHASTFDKNQWLYFTRQHFDLFYPAYGDTYPTYNGAVGMTYEQAGHSRAGLGVILDNKDTLTLAQRIEHHVATSLSTIKVASEQAKKSLGEFSKFFADSRNAVGAEFKAYMLTADSRTALRSLQKVLMQNGIHYEVFTPNKSLKGYNYFTGKDEVVQAQAFSIVVSAYQPKGALARVLLEPHSRLSDSLTYDITAWSLPFAHGIKAYGLREKIFVPEGDREMWRENSFSWKESYGYLLQWNSFEEAKALASLIKQGVKVRLAEREMVVGGKKYRPGTVIILSKQMNSLPAILKNVADSFRVSFDLLGSGMVDEGADVGSSDVRLLKPLSIALFTGPQSSSQSAGALWHFFEQELDYPVSLLNAEQLGSISLKNYDVIILPNGSYSFLSDKFQSEKLKQFVQDGGKLIVLQNTVGQLGNVTTAIKKAGEKQSKEEDSLDGGKYSDLKTYGNRNREAIAQDISGAIYRVELDSTHPLAFGISNPYFTMKQTADVYEFLKAGWNVGYIRKSGLAAGFVGAGLKHKLKDGTLIGEVREGAGSIVFFADDPLFRGFWQSGKLLMFNAIFFVQ